MRQSMTGFASQQGAHSGVDWTIELRGVNAKGLDVRLRVPDGFERVEADIRKRVSAAVSRGNVQISLRISSSGTEGAIRLDPVYLAGVLDAMSGIETRAMDCGLSLAPSTAASIVGLRGVLTSETPQIDQAEMHAKVLADFDTALAEFVAMRGAEGEKLADIMQSQLDEITTLVDKSAQLAEARAPAQAARLRTQLARVLDNADGVDETRVMQELALLAVKSDVTEEIDRLRAHVVAAQDLLQAEGPVGRKFDFLMQEFNREANTLCSKSGDPELTRTGLSLKTVIDQMREQVQNME